MKEKLLWFAIALLGLELIGAQAQAPDKSAQPQNGRFQVYALTYGALSQETRITQTEVFRLDTETGKTWDLIDAFDKDGTLTFGWGEVDELQRKR